MNTRRLGVSSSAEGVTVWRGLKGTALSKMIRPILIGLVMSLAFETLAGAQQAGTTPSPAPGSAKHVIGLEKIKSNAMGDLTTQGDVLQFKTGRTQAQVPLGSVQDVFTESDYKETIGGTAGTLAKMAVPFGGGRVLSLFREKIDVLTVEYRDSNGGLHGAIFALPQGQAESLKRQMVAQGVHASIPPRDAAKSEEDK